MDPIDSSQVFEQDPEQLVTEMPDGSALIELEVEESVEESSHYDNLVPSLDQYVLNTLASDLIDLVEKDREARKKRDEQQEEGIRRTGLGDDAPGGAEFSGASRVVHPVLAEGCVDFSARAMKELFPSKGPVKTKIYGKNDQKKLERARRKADYLNWQLTTQIAEYRAEKEIELTQLPLGGSQYLKFWPEGGRIHCEFVPIDDIYLPYAASNFYTAPRATHAQKLNRLTFENRVKSGLYIEQTTSIDGELPEESASQQATNKIEGKDSSNYNEDGVRLVYEVTCWWDIEDEGVKPYIIHIDESTAKVLGVYRNWAEDDAECQKLDWFQEDKFIPWRGIYGIGLLHLIGSLAGSATGALRALLDTAHINNAATAIKLKGGRASGQNSEVSIGEVQEIEAPPGTDDIRKVIMPMPFNAPSPVLYQLLEWLTAQAKGVVTTAEEKISDVSDRMPVGTALALIEQGSQVFSSIHARLHAGQKKALDIICRLNKDFPNEEAMERFNVTPEDFADNDDIDPVSDPNIFSETQRFAQLQEVMKLQAAKPNLKWNDEALVRRALELMKVDYVDEVLPSSPEPFGGDPVTENFVAAMQGVKLIAQPEQDHIAHLRAHVAFLIDPMFGAGPTLQGQNLSNILANCQEHLLQVYLGASKTAAAIKAMQGGVEGTEELIMAEGAEFAMQQLNQQMPNLVQQLQQAAQTVQQKMPQPPVDPAVQKTFEAAMAKTNADKEVAMAKLNQDGQLQKAAEAQKAQISQIQEQNKKEMADAKNFYDLQVQSAREQAQRLADELSARVELMKNEQDNQQHQHTEIVKNIQDNYTQLQIAMERGLADVRSTVPETPDMEPVMKQLNDMLSRVEKQKSEDAMSSVMQGLQGVIQSLNKPKMIVHDEQGRPVGIQ